MNRMLINARYPEEIRVAVVDENGRIENVRIENQNSSRSTLANIYKGVVTRVEPSLNAAFIDYGAKRHGFLPLKDVAPHSLPKEKRDLPIEEALQSGDEIIIQVEKEERGNKGAALTTYASLAGAYLVLMPLNHDGSFGISKRLTHIRKDLIEETKKLKLPKEMSLTLRTAGGKLTAFEWQQDLDHQLNIWNSIITEAENNKGPCFLFQESNIIVKSIRDSLANNIGEICIDQHDSYLLAKEMVRRVGVTNKKLIQHHNKETPIFTYYNIENQINDLFKNRVNLPSGGSIIIDTTEALTAIDVNSQSTKGTNIEETAYKTNLEAAKAIVRQLALRDIGGLIVVDFIDMEDSSYRANVEQKMHELLKNSQARIQLESISNLGLMEISRQRIRPALIETTHESCNHCHGLGILHTPISTCIRILRDVENSLLIHKELKIIVATDVGKLLANSYKNYIEELEHGKSAVILITTKNNFISNQYEIHYRSEQDKMIVLVDTKKDIDSVAKCGHRFNKPLVNNMASQPKIVHKGLNLSLKKILSSVLWLFTIFEPKQKKPSTTGYRRYRGNKSRHRSNNNRGRIPSNKPGRGG